MQQGENAKVETEKINDHVNNYCKTEEVYIEFEVERSQNVNKNENCKLTNTSVDKKSIKCEICDREFAYPCGLKNHMRLHTGEKPFKCNKCKRSFTQRYLLTKHIKCHEEEGREFICDICNWTFTHIQSLAMHLETCHGRKNVKPTLTNCNIRLRKLQSKSSSIAHVTCKHYIKKFTCKICKRNFRCETGYLSHMNSHALAKLLKPVVCKICHHEFQNNYALETHMRKHTGEKPFSCDTCHKKFAYKSVLVQHICVDGERPYMRRVMTVEERKYDCNICQTQFKSSHALACHMRKHKDDKSFSCDMCYKKFALKDALITHVCIGEKPDKVQTVKTEKVKNETEIYVRDRMASVTEMKRENIERDEMESGDIGIAEIKILAIQPEIKEEK